MLIKTGAEESNVCPHLNMHAYLSMVSHVDAFFSFEAIVNWRIDHNACMFWRSLRSVSPQKKNPAHPWWSSVSVVKATDLTRGCRNFTIRLTLIWLNLFFPGISSVLCQDYVKNVSNFTMTLLFSWRIVQQYQPLVRKSITVVAKHLRTFGNSSTAKLNNLHWNVSFVS